MTDVEPRMDDLDALGELAPIDLLLGEGTPEARERLRQGIAADPLATFAMAETVALVERCRELRVEQGPAYGGKLAAVLARAERRLLPPPSRWRGPLWGMAAAALASVLLRAWDPLRETHPVANLLPAAPPAATGDADPDSGGEPQVDADDVPVRVLDTRAAAWEEEVDTMRKRLEQEPSPHLRRAFEAALGAPSDALGSWLDPRNGLMLMRFDHELRGDAATRREALRRYGGLAAADERVQELAGAIATQLAGDVASPHAQDLDPGAVALAVRALLGAGPGGAERAHAVALGGDWLAQRIVTANDVDLVQCLAALVEVAAVTGAHHDVAARQGERLLLAVLHVDGENWSRRLPDLLGARVTPGVLAEASRVFGRLPAFGVDGGRCAIVRQLLLGPLRERRDRGEDSPQLVAAMLYGSADLLLPAERGALELQLRRWKPMRLVPDFATVQQLAWSLTPGRFGYTRHQAELRELAVCATPQQLGARAALCLALATSYAGTVGTLARLAGPS